MTFRYARHTEDLTKVETFYTQVVGLEKLGCFQNHVGYDGIFLGLPGLDWHLEFTTTREAVAHEFGEDNLLVFYVNTEIELDSIRANIRKAGIVAEVPRNPYWTQNGIMIRDPDGFNVVFSIRHLAFVTNEGLTRLVRAKNIQNWSELLDYIKNLPYGRNRNRSDLSLVMKEGKGTCSSKHSFLQAIAEENGFKNVKLILGMYKMSESNTPQIGDTISQHGLEYIPEAHCYLMLNNYRIDITTRHHHFENVAKDIIEEIEITPDQVISFKVDHHRNFLKKWITDNSLGMSLDDLWTIREQCIRMLGH